MEENIEVVIKRLVPYTIVEDIIVGALEGGSNYWYLLGEGLPPSAPSPLSERIAKAAFHDPEFKLEILDCETEEHLGYLTQESLKKGLETLAMDDPTAFEILMTEEGDAIAYDIAFQLIIMGEVIYA